MHMSIAEWINSLFFSLIFVLAWIFPISLSKRLVACAIGIFGIAICIFMAESPAFLSEENSRALRQWLPVLLILVAYHQSGRLFEKPWPKFQNFLLGLDRRLFGKSFHGPEAIRVSAFWSAYFEISYVVCYPLIPAALGALILSNHPNKVEEFWVVVLPATYACYALIPFFPALPPRLLPGGPTALVRPGKARAFNEWILRHASIRANTFPSAHVASCTAASLVLLRYEPWVGAVFLGISLSIAVSVVIRRYHYAADAILGVMLPVIPFLTIPSS